MVDCNPRLREGSFSLFSSNDTLADRSLFLVLRKLNKDSIDFEMINVLTSYKLFICHVKIISQFL